MNRLNSVDLPAFGGPMMLTISIPRSSSEAAGAVLMMPLVEKEDTRM